MAKRKDKRENEREREREREREKGKRERERERGWKRGTVLCEMMHIQFHSKHCFVIDIIYIAPVLRTVTYMKHCKYKYNCMLVHVHIDGRYTVQLKEEN